MDIQIFDFNLNYLKQIPNCNSRWELYYNDIGTFEGHISLSSTFVPEMIERLQNRNFFVVKQKNFAAIAIGYDAQNDFTLYGRTCNWILTKRVSKKFEEQTDTAQNIARRFVSTAFSDCPNFIIGSSPGATGNITFAKDSDGLTSDYVKECLSLKNYGHSVDLDFVNKQWRFNISNGVSRNFMRSEANKTAYNSRLTYDILDYANFGYYEKEIVTTDSEGNEETTTETASINAENKTGLLRWETLLSGCTESEARADLRSKKPKDNTSFSTRNIRYGIDYNLGDIFKLHLIKGIYRAPVERRVNGVEVLWNESGYSERPIFEVLEE